MKGRVVIVGGGLGGVEAALYLRDRLGDAAEITLIAPSDTFTFKPFLTYLPFGLEPQSVRLDLATVARSNGFRLMIGRVEEIRPDKKHVQFGAQSVVYDYLILATGAALRQEPVEGIRRGYAVWNEPQMMRLRERLLSEAENARAGERSKILFLVPPGCAWPGPLYELALMTSTWLHWNEHRDLFELKLVTPEHTFVEALGPAMHEPIGSELKAKGIEAETDRIPVRVETGSVRFDDGTYETYDVMIHAVSHIGTSPRAPFPMDEAGFIRTRLATRQIVGFDDAYAVGDVSDYPIKQGYLALLQADAAAEHLAARMLGEKPAFTFDPSALWMMEELDQALLAYSRGGDGSAESAQLEIGIMPLGRLRRVQMMGYLPRHSRLGNPLYAGLLWKGTEIGVKLLAQLHSKTPQKAT